MAPSSRWCFGRRHSDPQNNSSRDNNRNIVRDFIGDKKGDIVMNFSHNLYNLADFTDGANSLISSAKLERSQSNPSSIMHCLRRVLSPPVVTCKIGLISCVVLFKSKGFNILYPLIKFQNVPIYETFKYLRSLELALTPIRVASRTFNLWAFAARYDDQPPC